MHWQIQGKAEDSQCRFLIPIFPCVTGGLIDGLPSNDERERTFLALDAFTPYLAEHAETNAGKFAHYMLRWRMEDGSVSHWGESASSAIKG